MEAGLIQSFIREIGRQAKFGLMAAEDIDNALNKNDSDRVWYSIQNLLIAAANISKLLCPPNKAFSSRGDTLRNRLNIKLDSVILSRTARNHLEHFDERIESWGVSAQEHMVVDSNIGLLGKIQAGPSSIYVRNYNPSTKSLSIFNEEFELQPLIDELKMISMNHKSHLMLF